MCASQIDNIINAKSAIRKEYQYIDDHLKRVSVINCKDD